MKIKSIILLLQVRYYSDYKKTNKVIIQKTIAILVYLQNQFFDYAAIKLIIFIIIVNSIQADVVRLLITNITWMHMVRNISLVITI